MLKRHIILLCLLMIGCFAISQSEDTLVNSYFVVEDGDTIPVVYLDAPQIVTFKFTNKKQERKYNKIKDKVVKVYPYAQAAGELMQDYDNEMAKLDKKKDQKEFINLAEEELMAQFEEDLKEMTISEGVMLIKLIDRQTGDTSYELVQDLKGNFSAFMWQGLARIFGHNLKDEYSPEDNIEDLMIEDIVDRIELGLIDIETHNVNAPTADMIVD